MNRFTTRPVALALLCLALLCVVAGQRPPQARAQQQAGVAAAGRSAAQALPDTVISYFEITDLDRLVTLIEEHPLRKKIEAMQAVQQATKTPDFRKLKFGLMILEGQAGMKLGPLLRALAGEGVTLAIDGKTRGGVVLLKAKDPAKLASVKDTVLEFIRNQAASTNQPDPIRVSTHRGVETYALGPGGFAVVGPWLVLSNNADLGKGVLDRLVDPAPARDSLASALAFDTARKHAGQDKSVAMWTWTDLRALQAMTGQRRDLPAKLKDAGQELILGVLHQLALHANSVTGVMRLDERSASLDLHVPHDTSKIGPRAYAMGPAGEALAPAPLKPRGLLLSLGAYRDLGLFWNSGEELLDENGAAQLAKSDADLSTVFAGQSFSTEILPSLQPEMQFLLTRQSYPQGKRPPALLPAGALVFRAKEPKALRTRITVAYQSLVGFMNIQAGQQNRPAMIMQTKKDGDALILAAEYVDEDQDQAPEPAPDQARAPAAAPAMGGMYLNYSPTVAMVGPYLFICSSRPLAEELVTLGRQHDAAAKATAASELTIDAQQAALALRDNTQQLIAQNMLKEGNTLEQAQAQVSLFLDVVQFFKGFNATLQHKDGVGSLSLRLELAE